MTAKAEIYIRDRYYGTIRLKLYPPRSPGERKQFTIKLI